MLNYFRINDPYRLVIIFFILFIFRLPYFISPEWATIPELSWMIVGERMNEGALLYVGIWDDIGPLSAWTYRIIDYVFGRSILTLQILGYFMFIFQVFYINYIALKHKMYNENNYLPALFYALLGLTFFNIITLSPQLLGLTFVLLSLNSLFKHIETRNKTDGNLLNIGLYVGIASLFFLPYFIVIFIHVVGLMFFTNTIPRRYLLLLYGVCVPLTICSLIYVWYSHTNELFGNYFYSLVTLNTDHFISYHTTLILLGASILLFLLATIKIFTGFGFTVFQVRVQKTMFFGAVVMMVIYLFYADKDGYSFVMFFPWVAFFLSHFFISIKHNLKREISFLVYVLTIVLLYIGFTFNAFNLDYLIELDSLVINHEYVDESFKDKKILVLGPDIQPYANSLQATPYFDWFLSKDQLEDLNYYDNLEAINKNIRSDMPEFIIDQIGLAPKIFNQIPLLGEEYIQTEPGIYKRRLAANN